MNTFRLKIREKEKSTLRTGSFPTGKPGFRMNFIRSLMGLGDTVHVPTDIQEGLYAPVFAPAGN